MAKSSPALLLLPPPPTPSTLESLTAAYRPAINATISALKAAGSSTELQVVLPLPDLNGRLDGPRSKVYEDVQKLLGTFYSLVSVVCARQGAEVDSDLPGAIDARVILLDHYEALEGFTDSFVGLRVAGPIIDLQTFAITRRRWSRIFSVEGEGGQRLFSSYIHLANKQSPPISNKIELVAGGISLRQSSQSVVYSNEAASQQHYVVAVGGTFDHIHAGHKLLLTATALLLQPPTAALSTRRRLIVGVTGDELLKNKKYAEYLKSWHERQDDVVDFLSSILCFTRSSDDHMVETEEFYNPGPTGRAVHTTLLSSSITIECVEIQDPFGPTITEEDITALVVSAETRSGGQAVNQKRAEKGWKELDVYEVDVLDATDGANSGSEDFSSKISSTEIRRRRAELSRASQL